MVTTSRSNTPSPSMYQTRLPPCGAAFFSDCFSFVDGDFCSLSIDPYRGLRAKGAAIIPPPRIRSSRPAKMLCSLVPGAPHDPANFMVWVNGRKNNERHIPAELRPSERLSLPPYNHYSHQFRLGLLTYAGPPKMTGFPSLPNR